MMKELIAIAAAIGALLYFVHEHDIRPPHEEFQHVMRGDRVESTGESQILLPVNQKLLRVVTAGQSGWFYFLTRPMRPEDTPETYGLYGEREDRGYRIIESKE